MPATTEHSQLTAVILAGGRASRMAGEDKGLLLLGGRPLLSHVLDRFASLERVVISANRHIERYADFGLPVISDSLAGFPGPLAGMLAALEAIDTPYLLTAPCDSPRIPVVYLERMLAVINNTPDRAAVATDGSRIQPVFSLLPVQVASSLRRYLEDGERRASAWLRSIGAIEVDFSDCPEMFVNINSPDELRALETQLQETQA